MKKHPWELFSLTSGLVLFAYATVYAIAAATEATPNAAVMLSALLLGLGAAGLLATVAAANRRPETVTVDDATTPADPEQFDDSEYGPSLESDILDWGHSSEADTAEIGDHPTTGLDRTTDDEPPAPAQPDQPQ